MALNISKSRPPLKPLGGTGLRIVCGDLYKYGGSEGHQSGQRTETSRVQQTEYPR